MASMRKRLSMAFGFNGGGSPSTSKANSMDVNRGSIDSGYHSLIAKPERGSQSCLDQTTTFVTSGTESSPERSPKRLHKAISSTFSGAMQTFSNTVRSTTSYIYPTAGEPELPSSEWAECETPKKESRRSSIMSSVRSRKQRFTPRAPGAKPEPPELQQSPVPLTQEKAPALDVEIPNPSFSYESLGKVSASRGSQLFAGVKLPAAPKNLWPGPTRLTPDQASGIDRRESLHIVSSDFDDPYVENGDRLQHGLSSVTPASQFAKEALSPETSKRYLSDDKGYVSEVESNADVSETDGLARAYLEYVAPVSPEASTRSPCRHTDLTASQGQVASSTSPCQKTVPSRTFSSVASRSEPSKAETLDSTAEQTTLDHPSQRNSHHCAGLEDDLNTLLPSCNDAIKSKSRSFYKRLPSDVYDADAESLESSMGSRAAWERHRADRERRYMEIIDMAANTESDEEVEPGLELKRSPSKKPVHYAEEFFHDMVSIGGPESSPRYPTGDLRYAVEAIERPAFPVGDLAYAVEAIERPSVTSFDPLETVYQQRPLLTLSDTLDEQEEQEKLPVSEPQHLSPSRMNAPLSPPAEVFPSRVALPSSLESSPFGNPAAPKYTMMTMRLTDEELMTFGAGNLDGQSIRRFFSESTDVSANSSPEQQSRTAPEDAYEAGLRAAGIPVPTYPPEGVQSKPGTGVTYQGDVRTTCYLDPDFKESGHGTYREHLEAESTLPEQRSRNVTPFEHSRTQSVLSDETDDSCAITTHSPSCNAPSPFPSLHVRSEPARRILSVIDALATHGDEQIRIAGPANSGINHSLPSPFDGPADQTEEAESKSFSSKALEGADSPNNNVQATWHRQHDLQSPSPGTTSSIQSPSHSNTPQETFNAAKLPNFVSPSVIASRKARRKLKKSSSGMGTVPFTDITRNPRNTILEPEFSPPKYDLSEMPMSIGESARIAGGSVQKPSPNRQCGRKNRRGRDQASLEEFNDVIGGSVRWLDSSPKTKSSRKSLRSKGQATALSPGSAVKETRSPFEPEFSIQHFDSISGNFPLHANQNSDSTLYAGHELDSVIQTNPSVFSRDEMNKDFQQDNARKAKHLARGDESIGSDSEKCKDVSRPSGQKTNAQSAPEAEKKFAVQKELERKSDRACSRLVGKLNSATSDEGHVRDDNATHKEGRPPWRP